MTTGLRELMTRLRGALAPDGLTAAADAELLRRFADTRDDLAFAELVHRHAPAVYAQCRRHLTNPPDLDDAFQATFVVLVRKAGAIRSPEKLAAWLCGVADRVARTVRKRNTKRGRQERPLDTASGPSVPPEHPETDLRAVLDDELAKLPPTYREVVLLCDVDGVPRREAAKRLGVPDGTLSNRLSRARAMLGQRLLRRGVALGAGLSLSASASAVPVRLVTLTVSRIASGTIPPFIESLASHGLNMVLSLRAATAVVVGLCAAGLSFVTLSAQEPPVPPPPPVVKPKPADPVKAPPPAEAKKPTDPSAPIDPEPEQVTGYHSVTAATYSRDGKRFAIVRSDTKEVKVYDTAAWKVLHTFELGQEMCFAVQFSADGGTLYAAGYDGAVHTWDTKTGKAGPKLDAKAGKCSGLVLSPDGKRLASGYHDSKAGTSAIHLWDAATGKSERAITPEESLLPNTIAFSPDGKTVAGAYHAAHKKNPDPVGFHGVIEWDAATGKELKRFDTPRITGGALPVAHAIAYTTDGKKMILGGGEAVPIPGGMGSTMLYGYLWVIDRKSGEVEQTLVANRSDYIRTLAMSPDGKRLYVPAGSLSARVRPPGAPFNPVYEFQCWDTDTWEVSWSVTSLDPKSESQFAVSPDGKRVGAAGTRGFHLFDTKTGDSKGGLVQFVRPR